jgi:tetratricopeptide (TPR) repeat protein
MRVFDKRSLSPERSFLLGMIVLGCVATLIGFETFSFFRFKLQQMHVAVRQSAPLAYKYGTDHFDARKPYYSIEQAEYFFEEAYRIDPHFPYTQHQRARIAFLKGDFPRALYLINEELDNTPDPSPSSFYIRGLVKGYAKDYEGAVEDYRKFLEAFPTNWAAINDYAWVLLKAHNARLAYEATTQGLVFHPENPWLLNSHAIALYEMGFHDEARLYIRKAADVVDEVSVSDWLTAYPGNDPLVAQEGVNEFLDSVRHNMHTMALSRPLSTIE